MLYSILTLLSLLNNFVYSDELNLGQAALVFESIAIMFCFQALAYKSVIMIYKIHLWTNWVNNDYNWH